jgi:hypothetical protein
MSSFLSRRSADPRKPVKKFTKAHRRALEEYAVLKISLEELRQRTLRQAPMRRGRSEQPECRLWQELPARFRLESSAPHCDGCALPIQFAQKFSTS